MVEIEENRERLDRAQGFGEVWQIVKDNTKKVLKRHRQGMMLFLDDLPLRLGAYHPLGTNNIVLNRSLFQIMDSTTKSKRLLNSFVYTLLLHEYLHALGYIKEKEVRSLVYTISKDCFGEEHVTVKLAELGPWSLLKSIPLEAWRGRKQIIEIVKDFEDKNSKYII